MAPSSKHEEKPEKKAREFKVKHGQVIVNGEYRQVGATVKENELASGQAKQMVEDGFLEE